MDIKHLDAKGAAAAFFDAWKQADYKAMAKACQPSWRKFIKQDAERRMKDWFEEKKLTSYQLKCKSDITKQINKSKTCRQKNIKYEAFWSVQVKIKYTFEEKVYSVQLMVNVIMEQGVFKVNPTSVLRERKL